MLHLYTFLVIIAEFILKIISKLSQKIKFFIEGRNEIFSRLKEKNLYQSKEKIILIHTASLGEYEQALPVIKGIREKFPQKKIVVSFFSPSGYLVKKDTQEVDSVIYLPLDIPKKINTFLDVLNPEIVIFIKYEIWANTLNILKERNIPTYLVSGIFRENQIFFKSYGKFMKKALGNFTHFFVQNETSEKLLKSIGFQNITISGDTRFDRVLEILKRDNRLSFIEEFKNDARLIVLGSSWVQDEELYLNFINSSKENVKFIIAPHSIKKAEIEYLSEKINKKTLLFSQKEGKNLQDFEVFIVDTIGILTKIYAYADIAYVGGGMKTGLHNILEPAVFGIPIIIGKKFSKFQEAKDLTHLKGVISVKNEEEFSSEIQNLIKNPKIAQEKGQINFNYIKEKQGATKIILEKIFRN